MLRSRQTGATIGIDLRGFHALPASEIYTTVLSTCTVVDELQIGIISPFWGNCIHYSTYLGLNK